MVESSKIIILLAKAVFRYDIANVDSNYMFVCGYVHLGTKQNSWITTSSVHVYFWINNFK